uniref:KRAB domain-containing protein n=1 Tax=Laticauda laticaudata TaxID=8630 RepID=A0A8C5SK36_LATLA
LTWPSSLQVPVAFRDVAVFLSAEEWAELAGWQKDLYREVMAETFQLVSSLVRKEGKKDRRKTRKKEEENKEKRERKKDGRKEKEV